MGTIAAVIVTIMGAIFLFVTFMWSDLGEGMDGIVRYLMVKAVGGIAAVGLLWVGLSALGVRIIVL